MAETSIKGNVRQFGIDPFAGAAFTSEWRPDLTCGWLLLKRHDTREEALANCTDAREQWEGQTRVVTHAVVAAHGLGAEVFGEPR